jgi:hypothetical protein
MDFRDFDDPLLYADPDYREELYATWGGLDLSDQDDLSVLMLDSDNEGANNGASGEGDARDPFIPHLQGDLAMARPSTIRRLLAASAALRLRLQSDRADARLEAELQSFTLNDTFLCTGPGSLPSRLPDRRSITVTGDEIDVWLEHSTTFFQSVRDLTLWVRGAAIFLLPDTVLEDIFYAAWDLFCATLIFPRMRSAFEAFTLSPVASPEEARYRLAGVGPVGPPLPPSHARPFCAPWGREHYTLCRDDALDLEATAVIAISSLEVIIDWVMAAPVSSLALEVQGEASRTAWELFMASLRIPRACEAFELLCLDPPALQAAAGLVPPLPSGSTVEETSRRPRIRRSRR